MWLIPALHGPVFWTSIVLTVWMHVGNGRNERRCVNCVFLIFKWWKEKETCRSAGHRNSAEREWLCDKRYTLSCFINIFVPKYCSFVISLFIGSWLLIHFVLLVSSSILFFYFSYFTRVAGLMKLFMTVCNVLLQCILMKINMMNPHHKTCLNSVSSVNEVGSVCVQLKIWVTLTVNCQIKELPYWYHTVMLRSILNTKVYITRLGVPLSKVTITSWC